MNVNLWAQELAGTLAGTVVGALLAWLITHVYSRRAVRDMSRQRDQVQRYNRVLTALFHTWEEQGLVELARDPQGEITGGRVRSQGTSKAVLTAAAGADSPARS